MTSAEAVLRFQDLQNKAGQLGLILTVAKTAFYLTRPDAKVGSVYRHTDLMGIAIFLQGWEKKARLDGSLRREASETSRMGCLTKEDPRGEQ